MDSFLISGALCSGEVARLYGMFLSIGICAFISSKVVQHKIAVIMYMHSIRIVYVPVDVVGYKFCPLLLLNVSEAPHSVISSVSQLICLPSEGKRPLERPRHRWKYNTKVDLKNRRY